MSTTWQRTHTCGELTSAHNEQKIALCGWVSRRRNLGGLIFIDLRDRYGMTQIVFDPAIAPEAHALAETVRSEFVLWCQGIVRLRPEGMHNTKLPTGAIELTIHSLHIFSSAQTPPFSLDDEPSESLRLQYRYLDLRRPALQRNLLIRHQMLSCVRRVLERHQFVEIETPILYKSTPEGARDFLVPSRMHPGSMYALPQSPQTLKQLLMIAGFDRYFQIARCFRDEDLRADRQPEFSQIDIEQSFLDQESFFAIIENMITTLWEQVRGEKIITPFRRMTYNDAMNRFGSDKPDLRFEMELQDITSIFHKSQFQAFAGKHIHALIVQQENFSRQRLDQLTEFVKGHRAQGLIWIKVTDTLQSPAAKFFSQEETDALRTQLNLHTGDVVFIVADIKKKIALEALGALRLQLGKPRKEWAFAWIIDFPLLESDGTRYFACHHPFTAPAPHAEEDFFAGRNLENLTAAAYDLALNGVEIGGGSLRIYRPEMQQRMFEILGLSAEEAKHQFGFFLEALSYGTPPHGGMAFGVERLAAFLCDAGPIRDVMAFPKTQTGHCLMSGSPSAVNDQQLTELGIRRH